MGEAFISAGPTSELGQNLGRQLQASLAGGLREKSSKLSIFTKSYYFAFIINFVLLSTTIDVNV